MKMFIFSFSLLLFFDGGFAANIACQFLDKPPFYQCIAATVDPIIASNQAITVSGNHIAPYGNTNVSYIQFAEPQVLNYFPSLIFDTFPNLEHIQMRKVKFTTLTSNAIRNCSTLKYLYLYDNSFSTLPPSFMYTCVNAMILNLQFNQISTVDKYAFNGLWYVRELNLAYNNIAYLAPETFTFIGNLLEIYLSNNQITSIHPDTFAANTILQHVDLCNNKLTVLPAMHVSSSWKYLPGMYFSSNQIQAIDPSFLADYPGNRTNWILGLYDNICVSKDFANEFPVQQGDLDACYNTWRMWYTTTVTPTTTVTIRTTDILTPSPTPTTKTTAVLTPTPTILTTKTTAVLTPTPTILTTKTTAVLTPTPTILTTKTTAVLTPTPTILTTKTTAVLTPTPTTATTLKTVPNANINCQYQRCPIFGFYYCIPISIDPVTMENMNITTSGVHLFGYNERNVSKIEIRSPWIVNYIPSKMFAIFPNIASMTIEKASLTNLTTNAFRNCSKLINLNIVNNNFQTIPASFAETCTSLSFLSLSNNGIKTIDKNAFMGLNSLTTLGLSNNRLRVLPAIKFSNNPALIYVGFASNQIISIDPLLVSNFSGSRTWTLLLNSNLCINKIYVNPWLPIAAADFSVCYTNFKNGLV